MTTTIYISVDAIVDAYEARPDTKIRKRAWEWVSEQRAFTFQGDALVVPSATWQDTSYLATLDRCSCPAKGHCHHRESAQIVADAMADEARVEEAAERDEAYSIDELWA